MISNANSIVDVLNSLESVIFLFIFACLIFYLTLKFVKWTKKWTEDLKEKILKNLESKFNSIDRAISDLKKDIKNLADARTESNRRYESLSENVEKIRIESNKRYESLSENVEKIRNYYHNSSFSKISGLLEDYIIEKNKK
jgi:uncharacterized protein YlxW (UPF0749 family)